jgi:mRNA interferase RelE/StbE
MKYRITFSQAAVRDMGKLAPAIERRINGKIARLADGLAGDVKRLRNFAPRYRLRVGDWRVLFDIEGDSIAIHHVSHRSEAYE